MPHKDREVYLKYHKDYIQKNRDKIRARKLQQVHGISIDDYNDLLIKQHGVCAICFQPETTTQKRGGIRVIPLAVDHDHETNKVRGLLCTKCNTALGLLDDSTIKAQSLISYLERFK